MTEYEQVANGRGKDTPSVVFILAKGHSGSTILERAIASNPHCIGLGEVDRTIKDYRTTGFDAYGHACSCGDSPEECPVWSGLIQMTDEKDAEVELYQFLCSVVDSHGRQFIVDSSKRVSQLLVYKTLHDKEFLNLYTIHLVRDYRSWCTTRKFVKHEGKWAWGAFVRRAWIWMVSNVRHRLVLRTLGLKGQVVFYDEFAQEPEKCIKKIWSSLNLPIVPVGAQLNNVCQHALRGNGMRMDSENNVEVKYSDSWIRDWRVRWLWPIVFAPAIYNYHLKRKHHN